jgi:DNA-binding MarR family transcriptional regulator
MTNGQPTDPRDLEAVTRLVRACFNRLAAIGTALHADLGVTAAMRAVLETLIEDGPATVSAIARAKRVSRQNVQTLANALVASGAISAEPNPSDRRAPLMTPTAAGRATFATMRRREAMAFQELAPDMAGADLAAARATLERMRDALDHRLARQDDRAAI